MRGTHHTVLKDVVLEYFGHWQRHEQFRAFGQHDKADDALDAMKDMERAITVIDSRPPRPKRGAR